jgi:dihydropteroate synthase
MSANENAISYRLIESADPRTTIQPMERHTLQRAAVLAAIAQAGRPLLAGWSRKRTVGMVTGRPVGERLAGSVAAALVAVERGARIVRVHDVAATADALRVWVAARPTQSQAGNLHASPS